MWSPPYLFYFPLVLLAFLLALPWAPSLKKLKKSLKEELKGRQEPIKSPAKDIGKALKTPLAGLQNLFKRPFKGLYMAFKSPLTGL